MAGETKLASFLAQIMAVGAVNSLGPSAIVAAAPRAARGPDFFNTSTPNNSPQRERELPNVSTLSAALSAAEAVSKPLDFDAGIVYIPGDMQNNAGLVAGKENEESFIRQTPEEHQEALMQFVNKPEFAANPDKAIQLGIKAEEGLAKWWNDKEPRRPVTPTSSCVKKARIGANGDIYITFGSGNKEYQYEGSSDPVRASQILAELVGRPGESIGQKVNSWSGSWGKAHTYLPKG